MSGFQNVLASKRQIQQDFFFFFSAHLRTRRFLWKSEPSQLNTLAISIFHFDRGVFSFCPDGLFRLGWVPVWSYGHSF